MINPEAVRRPLLSLVKWAMGTTAILVFWATGFGAGRSFEQSRQEGRQEALEALKATTPSTVTATASTPTDNPRVDYCYIEADFEVSPTDPLGPEIEHGWALWGHRAGATWHMRRYLGGRDAVHREDVVAEAMKLGCPLKEKGEGE